MGIFFASLISAFILLTLGGLSAFLLWRPISNWMADQILKRLLTDPYPENLSEMLNVFTKEGVQNVLESDLRASNGQILQRPFGSPAHRSPWDDLLFNPVYLTRLPIDEGIEVKTDVVIGPLAKKPLKLGMPIIIGGMAYGIGVSKKVRLALAQGADAAETAVNIGVGPLLPGERLKVKRLILQYHRGSWGKDEDTLKQADMIEIQLGYGALGSAPVSISSSEISEEFRDFMQLKADEGLTLQATLPDVKNGYELAALVQRLRQITGGVPIGVKIGATHLLEQELDIIARAKLDFITIDGSEAGINYGPAILGDDLGLPTLPALCRAANYLQRHRLRGKVSLIVSGGLVTPGQFLKAIALGADAVAIGTIIVLSLAHIQIAKATPFEPPTDLVLENGKYKDDLSVKAAAKSVSNFLKSCNDEIVLAMRSMGRTALDQLTPADLCALTRSTAEMTGVEFVVKSNK
jgi:glutamate synthase domain-containing protein 2